MQGIPKHLAAVMLFAMTIAPFSMAADEPYDVTIVFLGLMTWDLPKVTPKVATVIIPDLTDGAKIGNDKHPVHEHVAYLLADMATMPKNHRLNKDHQFEAADEEGKTLKYRYIVLEGESISIDPENVIVEPKELEYENTGCRGNPCPTKDNETAMCWLSSMREVHDGAGQTKDEVDHFNRLPERTTIAGRMVLRHGDLKARVIKNKTLGHAPVWGFGTPKSVGNPDDIKLSHALAQEVHWTFRAKGSPFVLNLLGFDGKSRRVAFLPTDNLLIVIGNTTPEDTGPVAKPTISERDDHYSVYHRFIEGNKDGFGKIPHRIPPATLKCEQYTFDPILEPKSQTVVTTVTAPKHHDKSALAKKPAAITTTNGGPQPSPGGLNCSGNQWP